MTHTDFGRAFTAGRIIERAQERLRIEAVKLGALELGAEGLWIFDPGFARRGVPLDLLPPGSYRVEASIVHATSDESGRESRVVAALLAIAGQGEVVRWVDAGTVSCDSGWISLSTSAEAQAPVPESEDTLHTWRPGIASCLAGYGDGGYGYFVGYDAADRAVACAVDFFILVAPKEALIPLPLSGFDASASLSSPALEALGLKFEVPPLGTLSDGQPVWMVLDARGRQSAEVTNFELRAWDAAGAPVFVGHSAQGLRWTFFRPEPSIGRLELALQTGVEAL